VFGAHLLVGIFERREEAKFKPRQAGEANDFTVSK